MKSFTATAGPWKSLLLLSLICGCTTPEQRVTPSVSAPPGTKTNAAAESKTDTVEIKEMKFQPAVLTVTRGTTVVFVNNDMVTHDITEATKAWSSNLLPPSKSWSMVADKTVDYFCSIHVVMKGRIEVK